MSRKRRKRPGDYVKDSMRMNQVIYNDYINQMTEILLNSIKYDGLPDTVDNRWFELNLITKGMVCYFRDEELGDLCLPCTATGRFTVNNIPTRYDIISPNGYTATRDYSNAVLVYNNYLRLPSMQTIKAFAHDLCNARRAMSVNIGNQKFPFLLSCTETQRMSVENAFMQIDGNCPVILTDKGFDPDSIKSYELAIPMVADKIHDEIHKIWNDFLTWAGIENSNQDKKERLVVNEVGSNYGNVEVSRSVRLKARQEAFDRVNKMFGTNIEVSFNSELSTMLNAPNIGYSVDSNGNPLLPGAKPLVQDAVGNGGDGK